MKEFIEKLIGRLEDGIFSMDERMKYDIKTQKHLISQNQGIRYAINSINQLAEEYINTSTNTSSGWISCSSGNFSTSEVLVCKEDGTIDFDVFDFMVEDWKFNSNHHKNKVIAWQPLPQPYAEQKQPTWQQQTMNRFERVE